MSLILQNGSLIVFGSSPRSVLMPLSSSAWVLDTGIADARLFLNKALPTLLDLAQRATGKRPAEVALVSDNTASGVSFMKPMRAAKLAKNGVRAVVDEVYTPLLSDASFIVQHVRSSRPQFILMTSSNVPHNKLLLDKFAEYKLGSGKLPKIGNGGATGAPELGAIVGADIINGYMGIAANWGGRGQEALAKRFIERTKEPWLNQDSIITYADIMILKEAAERSASNDPKKMADAMRAFDLHDGPALLSPGGHLTVRQKGRRAGAGLVIIQWQAGKAVAVHPPSVATAEPIWSKA